MTNNPKISALVPSAGMGTRFGSDKIFTLLTGKPVLIHTLERLSSVEKIVEIIVITREGSIPEVTKLVDYYNITKVKAVIKGGQQRQDSVFNGLLLVQPDKDIVLIHDGVRPLVTKSLINRAIDSLQEDIFDGIVVGFPLRDTIKRVKNDTYTTVVETPRRDDFWCVQTPQVFYYDKLMSCYEMAYKDGFYSTDDSAIVERYGGKVRLILGEYTNIKITTPEDIIISERYLQEIGEHL